MTDPGSDYRSASQISRDCTNINFIYASAPLSRTAFTLESFGLTLPDLLAMLRRENELRLSPATQELYRRGGYDKYVEVTEGAQKQVRLIIIVIAFP